MSDRPNRRRHRRVAPNLPCAVEIRGLARRVEGRLLDVSEGGALLLTNELLSLDPPVRLHFRAGDLLCEAAGWVTRSLPHAGGQGTALEFRHANAAFVDVIRKAVAAAEAERREFFATMTDLVIEIG